MKDTAKIIVRELFDLLEAHGVKDIVCSPGSRNMPLLIAADSRQHLRKHVVIDERSAAFVALGMAQTSQKPVALVCTSGTALLNYAPAAAEAYYQGLPLIVISADRPKEWIDQDDSQTIRQYEALANFVKKSYDIDDANESATAQWYANRTVNDALINATRPKQGPVHINIHLSVPLDILEAIDFKDTEQTTGEIGVRKISLHEYPTLPLRAESRHFAQRLLGKKVMLVAGFMLPDAVVDNHIRKFAKHSNVAVMAETISNLHIPAECYVIDAALSNVREWSDEYKADMYPDVVITIGGALVSRRLKEFLRRAAAFNPEMEHWSFGAQDYVVDCFKALTLKIEDYPAPLLGQISAEMAHLLKLAAKSTFQNSNPRNNNPEPGTWNPEPKYRDRWNEIRKEAASGINTIAKNSGWSELKALDFLFNNLPSNWNLQLSNGTVVRYNQILMRKLPHAVFCNRGVSGIDGSTSTAVGQSVLSQLPTLLVTGDMSASYDLGGLMAAKNLDSDLKIVVINNQGGSIFRFVKSTRHWDGREQYLCADPQTEFSKLADTFGFEYLTASDFPTFTQNFRTMLHAPGRVLLEIFIDPESSTEVLKQALSAH